MVIIALKVITLATNFSHFLILARMKRNPVLVELKFKRINLTALKHNLIYPGCLLTSLKISLRSLLKTVITLRMQSFRLTTNILFQL